MSFFPPPNPRSTVADPRTLFAREAEMIVRQTLDLTEVRYDPAQFALFFKTGTGDHSFFLVGAFQETREMAPEKRRARIAFIARAVDEHDLESPWAVAAPRLVPLLRSASVETGLTLAVTGGRSLSLARRPFLPFLHACLAMDNETSTTYVSTDELGTWNVSLDAALGRAVENLAQSEMDHSVESYDPSAAYPIWHVTAKDGYEASRLLLPGWLAGLACKVRGRPLAIVPERAQLIVAGDADDKAIERLLRTADGEFTASSRRISPGVYTVDPAGRVVPYLAPPSHPLAPRTKIAQLKLGLHEYDQQAPALEERVTLEGLQVFVAPYQVFDTDAVGPVSFTVWAKGVDSLLPIADIVALDRKDGSPPRFVPWAAMTAYAWANLQSYPSDPPRMRTCGWPDEVALQQIEAHAVRLQTT